MTRFYTQTGDEGYTGLLGEERPAKYDLRIEALGTIDEANAAIGFARSICTAQQLPPIMLSVQRDLYHLMAEIAAEPENASIFRTINADRVTWLENQIDLISSLVEIPSQFIIPGDSQGSAAIDLARAIVRRAERLVAHLFHLKLVENRELIRYLNRLSSLCFVLELLEIHAARSEQPTLATK